MNSLSAQEVLIYSSPLDFNPALISHTVPSVMLDERSNTILVCHIAFAASLSLYL